MFKRYSEIRALYKELKIIYENRNAEKKKFPRFAKGHYFGKEYNSKVLATCSQTCRTPSQIGFRGGIDFYDASMKAEKKINEIHIIHFALSI